MFIHVNCYFNSRELIYITYFFFISFKEGPSCSEAKGREDTLYKRKDNFALSQSKMFCDFHV